MARAAGLVTAGYLAAGSLLSAGMLLAHFSDAVALQRQLAPGAAGLPVALLGIAATPNAVLAGVSYLTGPGFDIGTHTSVSAFSVSSGRLPVFPLLAGLPHQQPAAWSAGWRSCRPCWPAGQCCAPLPAARPWRHRLADCAAAAGLAGLLLAVLTGLAAGDLGSGALRGIGAAWWAGRPAATAAGAAGRRLLAGRRGAAGQVRRAGRPRPVRADVRAVEAAMTRRTARDAGSRRAREPRRRTGESSHRAGESVAEPATRSRTAS